MPGLLWHIMRGDGAILIFHLLCTNQIYQLQVVVYKAYVAS